MPKFAWKQQHFILTKTSTGDDLITDDAVKSALDRVKDSMGADFDNPFCEEETQPRSDHARKMLKEILTEGGGKWIKPSGSNDKRVLCPFCARCMPAVSTDLNIHIATDCALDHPARAEAALAVVGSKTALKRLCKDKQDLLNKIKEEYTTSTAASLSTFNQSLGGSAPANPPNGASPGLNLGANAGAGSGKCPYNDLPRLTTIGSSARPPRWTSGSGFQCMRSSTRTEKLSS